MKSSPYPKEIIQRAKELYTDCDELGTSLYTDTQVANILNEEFEVILKDSKGALNPVTCKNVVNWARRYGWREALAKAREKAVTKEMAAHDLVLAKEDIKMETNAERFRKSIQTTDKMYYKVMEMLAWSLDVTWRWDHKEPTEKFSMDDLEARKMTRTEMERLAAMLNRHKMHIEQIQADATPTEDLKNMFAQDKDLANTLKRVAEDTIERNPDTEAVIDMSIFDDVPVN